jgi:hypothetical protein
MVQNWNKVSVLPVVKAQDTPPAGAKYVEIEPDSSRYAAKVVKVMVGKQVVTPGPFNRLRGPSGVPFQAGDDWLKNLTFTIKNTSSKKFVELYTHVCFPETEIGADWICQGIELGRIPDIDAYTDKGDRFDQGSARPLDFRLGQEMQITFAPYASEIRRRIEERQPFSTISRCFINVHTGYFEDGMQWLLYNYSVPDPSHHGKFIPADESQIPAKDKR